MSEKHFPARAIVQPPPVTKHSRTESPASVKNIKTLGVAMLVGLSILATGCVTSGNHQASSEVGYTITGNAQKWDAVSLAFQGPTANAADNNPNPFLDYRLQVTFAQGSLLQSPVLALQPAAQLVSVSV